LFLFVVISFSLLFFCFFVARSLRYKTTSGKRAGYSDRGYLKKKASAQDGAGSELLPAIGKRAFAFSARVRVAIKMFVVCGLTRFSGGLCR
jgi:hypothetical protein